jgi:hypothetical protein
MGLKSITPEQTKALEQMLAG